MKNIFTGAWLSTIVVLLFYFIFRYFSLPFTLYADEAAGGTPLDAFGKYFLSTMFTFAIFAFIAFLILIFHKIGEEFNNR